MSLYDRARKKGAAGGAVRSFLIVRFPVASSEARMNRRSCAHHAGPLVFKLRGSPWSRKSKHDPNQRERSTTLRAHDPTRMNVLHAASECFPLVKTGGL
ncbi:MAG: hypothetical protein ACREVL_12330, partial [Solimonas sp.]